MDHSHEAGCADSLDVIGSSVALLSMIVVPAPQQVEAAEAPAPAVLVDSANRAVNGAAGLGDGGVTAAAAVMERPRPGRVRTVGGVLVRAQTEGVKLDFPSGIEVLFTPSSFLHLRTGEQVGPFLQGLELELADGSVVHMESAPTSRNPLRQVTVQRRGRWCRLWWKGRADARTTREPGAARARLLVYGEGDACYRKLVLGPLQMLERVLCSEARSNELPRRCLVLDAAPLVASLRRLPGRFPKPTTEFPEVDRLARELAMLGPRVFAAGQLRRLDHERLRYQLGQGFELEVVVPRRGVIRLQLHAGDGDQPLVEWTVGAYSELHMLNPKRFEPGALRYYRRGLPLRELDASRRDGVVPDIEAARGFLMNL